MKKVGNRCAKACKTAAKKSSRGQKRKTNSSKDDAQPSTSTAREKKSGKHRPETRCRPTATATKKGGRKKCKAAQDSSDSCSEDEEWPCIICGEPFTNSNLEKSVLSVKTVTIGHTKRALMVLVILFVRTVTLTRPWRKMEAVKKHTKDQI